MTKDTHTCPVCGNWFFPKRSDAIYCSARCRKRAQRKKTNRVKSEKQSLYSEGLRIVRSLQGQRAHNQLRALLVAAIEGMPDEERVKLYRLIHDDVARVKRDSIVTDKR